MSVYLVSQQSKLESLKKLISKAGRTDIVGSTTLASSLLSDLSSIPQTPDVLVALRGGDSMKGVAQELLNVRKQYQEMRIVFLVGGLNMDNENNKKSMSALQRFGINVLYNNPDVDELARLIEDRIIVETPHETTEELPLAIPNNIFVVSSAKAGSGKSFVSTNLAAILAKNGRRKDGERPTVLLVEGDLQTLSVGTLLGINDNEHNLKEALIRIREIVDSEGNVVGTPEKQQEVQRFIEDCCLMVTENIPNWAAVVSSTFSVAEREEVSPFHYFYLINVLANLFDIVIVDSNSAIEHRTTGPVLQAAREIMMVVTSDYDGVRIANKAREELATIGVEDKVVYVLNKKVTKAQQQRSSEQSTFQVDKYFDMNKVAAQIPYIDQVVQYNCIYEHSPLVLNESKSTLIARIQFTLLAGRIWPMDNTKKLAREVEMLRNKKR